MKLSTSVIAFSAAVLAIPVLGVPHDSPRVAIYRENVARGLRLVKTSEESEKWMTEDDKLKLIRSKTRFFDITEQFFSRLEAEQEALVRPTANSGSRASYAPISHTSQVRPLLSQLSISNMQSTVNNLAALNNRYYKSSTGAQASTMVYNQAVSIKGSRSDISVTQFQHSWGQNSVIVKFAGSGATTIFGCHLDSINQNSPSTGRAPGADDNATGVANLMEAFRVLVASGFKPTSPLEFHFNAAEEGGLLGSQAIAASYKKAGVQVKGYTQLDMTAYFKPGSKEVIALVDDYVDAGFTSYLKSIVTTYCAIPAGTDHCGYACSDHASWYQQGYPTANPFEAPTAQSNQYIHTSSDTTSLNGFSWTHSLEFAKMTLAAAYELTV